MCPEPGSSVVWQKTTSWETNWKGGLSQILDSFLKTSCMSHEEFTRCSAVDGEVCGLELDLISVVFKGHSSDGI